MSRDLTQVIYDAVMHVAFLNGIVLMRAALEPGTKIIEDLNFDSLTRTALVMELENRLQIVCENGDAEEARTLGDVIAMCRHLLDGRAEPTS